MTYARDRKDHSILTCEMLVLRLSEASPPRYRRHWLATSLSSGNPVIPTRAENSLL